MTAYLPNFPINQPGRFSSYFIRQNIKTFAAAIGYLEEMTYQRWARPSELEEVLVRRGGTFTARHALLVQVAREQGVAELTLALGVYDFDRERWPKVDQILTESQLTALPEVCGCIKYQGQLYSLEESERAKQNVISEIEIAPAQIGNFKKRFHLNYLANWLQLEKLDRCRTAAQLWQIREKCLEAIAYHWNRRPMLAL